jgi:hypothetical protein
MNSCRLLMIALCLITATLACSTAPIADNKSLPTTPGPRSEKVSVISAVQTDKIETLASQGAAPSANKKWANVSIVYTPSKESETIPINTIRVITDSGQTSAAEAIAFPENESKSTASVFFEDIKKWDQMWLIGRWVGLYDNKNKLQGIGYLYCKNEQQQCQGDEIKQIVIVQGSGTELNFNKPQPTKFFLLFQIPDGSKARSFHIGQEPEVTLQ